MQRGLEGFLLRATASRTQIGLSVCSVGELVEGDRRDIWVGVLGLDDLCF